MGDLEGRQFYEYLIATGVKAGMQLAVHSSFRHIKKAFPGIRIEDVISGLCEATGKDGSVIMPAFSYCFRKTDGVTGTFNRKNTPSQVGAIAELFRSRPETERTSSPTHSFTLWGYVKNKISPQNNPASPLGRGSVMDWLHNRDDGAILMLGTRFDSLSFGHFIEISTPVPWADISPWKHLNIQPIGASIEGDVSLKELPGCSKSFVNFESWLLRNNYLEKNEIRGLESCLIPTRQLYQHGISYFSEYPDTLLCSQGSCQACDERWVEYLAALKRGRI